jgi:transposase IS66 family protein
MAALLSEVVLPDWSQPGAAVRVQVFALRRRRRGRRRRRTWLERRCRRRGRCRCRRRRRRRARGRCRCPGERAGLRGGWSARLGWDLARWALVAAVNEAAGTGLAATVVVGVVLLLREGALVAGLRWGSLQVLRWLPALDRLARLAVFGALMWPLVAGAAGSDDSASGSLNSVLTPVVLAEDPVTVEVEHGRARLLIRGPVVLELPVQTDEDERLAMVLCRLLVDDRGKAVLTHQAIATAFGKKSRQCCQNHLQDFVRAGASLTQMVLRGRAGRPSRLHPLVLEAVARHWERSPLASLDETCQWLAAQKLPASTPLPDTEQLRATRRIEGNLILMRNATRRRLERSKGGVAVRPELLVERLLEVVDQQAQQLRDAGLATPSMPGLIEAALGDESPAPRRPSRTGRALMTTLQALTTPPSAEQDEELCAAIGASALSPLHFGALYCLLQLSIGQVAALVGRSKSVVYRGLLTLARTVEALDPFPAATGFSGVLGLDEKWLRIPKSYSAEQRKEGKRWRYAHFAVDALTGDLLHIDAFDTASADAVRVFLSGLRAKGIRPKVVVTDMLAAYGRAITETFGPGVRHHYCLFHHLQAVRHRLRDKCGIDWKTRPLLRRLVKLVDHVYDCRDPRTAKKRLGKVLALREDLALNHPEVLPLLDTIEERFPMVANAIGREDVPTTNNVTERTIKAFTRHYKNMAGLESIETARVQLRLFRFFYRLRPMREAARVADRGKSPLERAGWHLRGIPIADYVRRFTEVFAAEGPELFSPLRAPPRGVPPSVEKPEGLATAA